MKRGLIAWDKNEIDPAVFDARLQQVRDFLSEQRLPALVVYSELWRSNPARYFSNFMPYFNRALLILPLEGAPTLLCGLSPRVYSWIRSVTTIEDVRPAGNFARPLAQLASERRWDRIGCLDFAQFPQDLYQALRAESIVWVPVDSARVYSAGTDDTESAMRRKAYSVAKQILAEELPRFVGEPDHHLVGQLERRFRRAGVEDLIVLLTNGHASPTPPTGAALRENFSVSLAVEYRGHWIRLSRPCASADILEDCKKAFDAALTDRPGDSAVLENLSGSYPYECVAAAALKPLSIVAIHTEYNHAGKRLFYGDTCICDPSGFKPL
jgi:hypothetical protein